MNYKLIEKEIYRTKLFFKDEWVNYIHIYIYIYVFECTVHCHIKLYYIKHIQLINYEIVIVRLNRSFYHPEK